MLIPLFAVPHRHSNLDGDTTKEKGGILGGNVFALHSPSSSSLRDEDSVTDEISAHDRTPRPYESGREKGHTHLYTWRMRNSKNRYRSRSEMVVHDHVWLLRSLGSRDILAQKKHDKGSHLAKESSAALPSCLETPSSSFPA